MSKRRRNKRNFYWLVFLILLLIAGVIGYKVWEGYFKTDGSSPEEMSSVKEKEEKKNDDEAVNTGTDDNVEEEPLEKKVEQYDGNNPNANNELTGVITFAGVSGDYLIVRVNIDQFLMDGSCELKLIREGSNIYSDTVEIIDSASTATCKGFNVPINNLGKGKININILLTAEGKTGIIKGEVTL
ncbi:hypothetical protein IKX73_02885 [Candidatus Saccharibacteria bacterium]|nr:hypothetical protein [Candidatus Saccharibacteria bacterium]